MSEREVRDGFAAVETPQGSGRRSELTDLDGQRVGVIVRGRGGISVFIGRRRDGESAAVATLDEQQAHLLRHFLPGGADGRCDVGEAGSDESPLVRLLSSAGTPGGRARARRSNPLAGVHHRKFDCDENPARLHPAFKVTRAVDLSAASRRRHPSSIDAVSPRLATEAAAATAARRARWPS
jgi:hypothetical protein